MCWLNEQLQDAPPAANRSASRIYLLVKKMPVEDADAWCNKRQGSYELLFWWVARALRCSSGIDRGLLNFFNE